MNIILVCFLVGLAFILGFVIGRQSTSPKTANQGIYRNNSNLLSLTDRQEILDLLRQGNKIQAIKHYRSLTNSGLKEAKEAVEQLELEI